MKLAISNLAWNANDNDAVYAYLSEKGFTAIEIAPTKLFPEAPYEHLDEAIAYAEKLRADYGLSICSMQSIWYGQGGNIFASDDERDALRDYTFRAVDFAAAIGCGNLVFGNPKARNRDNDRHDEAVAAFFSDIARYADARGTCIALEPNPTIYNTNFINTTAEAFDYCRRLPDGKLRVNIDCGTMIWNGESVDAVRENISLVNHIHISEPYLKKIEKRDLHRQLCELLYDRFVSVEMGAQERLQDVFDVIDYVAEVLV